MNESDVATKSYTGERILYIPIQHEDMGKDGISSFARHRPFDRASHQLQKNVLLDGHLHLPVECASPPASKMGSNFNFKLVAQLFPQNLRST